MKRIFLIFIIPLLLGAATLIPWPQINNKLPKTGSFYLTGINGVVTWSILPTFPTPTNFADAEVPSGIANGTNLIFTLAHPPVGTSLELTLNGVVQQVGLPNDFVLNGNTITFNTTAAIPQMGDSIQTWYRY
jgi:hypothetical protein